MLHHVLSMAAALLSDEDCVINDAPALLDVDILCRLLETLGAVVRKDLQDNVVTINSADISSVEASSKLVKQMRASILVMNAQKAIHRREQKAY